MIFLELFYTFFLIGLFTIGGGYAMLSLIQAEVVTKHAWLTEQAFTDIVAISQMTPGPIGINSATFVGYTVVHDMGYSQFVSILGSAATTFALVLPSFIIFFIIIKMVSRFGNSPIYKGVMGILKSAVAGLIGAAAVVLITPENFIDAWSWILFAAAFALSWWGKTNPILIIIGAGVAGFSYICPDGQKCCCAYS